eukprot:14017239-Ditylum_brightwellii.AAC.1
MNTAEQAELQHINVKPHKLHFDSNLFVIGIDNQASCCIDLNEDNSIDLKEWPKGMKKPAIKNFGEGFTDITGRGTTRWRFEDNQGRVHTHN